MGWLALIALHSLLQALPLAGVVWLVVGGLFFTVGIVFYAADGRLRHAHGIWHVFVLTGSATHYLAILFYVA
jgi:hemolysin III